MGGTGADLQYMGGCRIPARAGAADLCLMVLERCRGVVGDLAEHSPPLCFCRADARFANVIRRPNQRLGLVDWEDSGLCDPVRDVADLLTHPNQEDLLSWENWQAFLQPYLAAFRASDPHLPRRLHLYLALLPLFWIVTLLSHGVAIASSDSGLLASWTINELPANCRLRRYLARALAWPSQDIAAQVIRRDDLFFFPDPRDRS